LIERKGQRPGIMSSRRAYMSSLPNIVVGLWRWISRAISSIS
jgi:hypothetical protein